MFAKIRPTDESSDDDEIERPRNYRKRTAAALTFGAPTTSAVPAATEANRVARIDTTTQWPGRDYDISVSDLGKRLTLPTGSTITIGTTTEVQFVNSLVNCTVHPVRIMVRNEDDDTSQHFIVIEPSGNALCLRMSERRRISTMPAHYRDDDQRVRQTHVNIMREQIPVGFTNDVLPRISRSKCPGIIVSMRVARFLDNLDLEELDDMINDVDTDLDEYNADDEHDRPPICRKRVRVFTLDADETSFVRTVEGISVRNLCQWNAVY